MSLKEKIAEKNMYKDSIYDEKQQVISLIDDAVALYKDARDHPEKHKELVREYFRYLGCNIKFNQTTADLLGSSDYRDFLFRKIFEEE